VSRNIPARFHFSPYHDFPYLQSRTCETNISTPARRARSIRLHIFWRKSQSIRREYYAGQVDTKEHNDRHKPKCTTGPRIEGLVQSIQVDDHKKRTKSPRRSFTPLATYLGISKLQGNRQTKHKPPSKDAAPHISKVINLSRASERRQLGIIYNYTNPQTKEDQP
jgi:hypothetical protein